jgi:threonylcarbamoyladenosine tRNA methylthiotransferase MtaB
MKVYIESMGCDSSISDANQLRECCLNNSLEITGNYMEADYIVLFSCGFNSIILSENINRFKKFYKNQKAKLILTGCVPKIKPSFFRIADFYFGSREMHKFNTLFNFKKKIEEFSPNFNRKDKKIIRISTGCCGKCSYCAIKIATGYVKSRKAEEIIKDIKQGLKEGINKFVFTSEDNGSWGQDFSKNICNLLEKITHIGGDFKILLTTFNPRWFIKYPELYSLFKSSKFEKNIYLSLQSGSNRMLKLMNRGYSVKEYLDVYNRLKKEIPEIKIRSDFLVGFPSENNEDFNETLKFIQKLDFYFIQVFSYTDMEGTTAKNIGPKINKVIKEKRVKKIIKLFLEKNKNEKRELINTNIIFN